MKVNGVDGRLSELGARATWMFSDNFGLGLGYSKYTSTYDVSRHSFDGRDHAARADRERPPARREARARLPVELPRRGAERGGGLLRPRARPNWDEFRAAVAPLRRPRPEHRLRRPGRPHRPADHGRRSPPQGRLGRQRLPRGGLGGTGLGRLRALRGPALDLRSARGLARLRQQPHPADHAVLHLVAVGARGPVHPHRRAPPGEGEAHGRGHEGDPERRPPGLRARDDARAPRGPGPGAARGAGRRRPRRPPRVGLRDAARSRWRPRCSPSFHRQLFHEVFADEMGAEIAKGYRSRGNLSAIMLTAVMADGPAAWFDRVDTPADGDEGRRAARRVREGRGRPRLPPRARPRGVDLGPPAHDRAAAPGGPRFGRPSRPSSTAAPSPCPGTRAPSTRASSPRRTSGSRAGPRCGRSPTSATCPGPWPSSRPASRACPPPRTTTTCSPCGWPGSTIPS